MKIGIIFPKDSKAMFDTNCDQTFGGATVQMHTIAEELQRRFDNEIFCIVPEISSPQEKYTKWNLREVFKKRSSTFKTILSFHVLVRKEKPDVLIQHGLTLFSCLLALYCKIKRIKFVFMFANDKEVNAVYQSSDKKCLFFNLLIRYAAILVVQNSFQECELLKKYKKKGLLLRVGFPLQNTKDQAVPDTVLWVARCDQWKNPELYIQVAEKNPNIEFVMICPRVVRKDEYFSQIKEKATIIPNLKFIDFVPFHETWKYFLGARLFVNTSKDEGFPQTFVQAVSCGVPIVSLNTDPNGIMKNYQCGSVCDGNFDKLNQEVIHIMSNEVTWKQLSENASVYASKFHNIKENIDLLIKEIKN